MCQRLNPLKNGVKLIRSLGLGLPGSFGNSRQERLEVLWWELQSLASFGAHIGRHQNFHHLETVIEGEHWLLTAQERARHVTILPAIAVDGGLFGYYRHQTHLRVLLLDEVLTRFSLHLPAEEHLEAGVERIPGHGVLGAQQLGGQSETRAD